MNCFLLEKVWCLLSNALLDMTFWAKALEYASHVMNKLSSTAIRGKTPLDIWSGGSCSGLGFTVGLLMSGLIQYQIWQYKFASKKVCVFRYQEKYERLQAMGPRK